VNSSYVADDYAAIAHRMKEIRREDLRAEQALQQAERAWDADDQATCKSGKPRGLEVGYPRHAGVSTSVMSRRR